MLGDTLSTTKVNHSEEIAIKYKRLIGYLEEQTSWIAELEAILTKTGPSNPATTSQSIVHFLRDLQIKNKQMIQSQVLPTHHASSFPFASSSPARVSFEFEDSQDRFNVNKPTGKEQETATKWATKAPDPSSSRMVHFEDLLYEQSESLLISSDDDESTEQNVPTVIASLTKKRNTISKAQETSRDSSDPGIAASSSNPRRKTLHPPAQVKVSNLDNMSVLSEIGSSPMHSSRQQPFEVTMVAGENSSIPRSLDDDSWSTETPFFDRFRVDYDPDNPRKVLVRPNPRRSRRGKLAELKIARQIIDENAPLDFSRPFPGHTRKESRSRDVFRVNETQYASDAPCGGRPFVVGDVATDSDDRRAIQGSKIDNTDDVSAPRSIMDFKEFSSQTRLPVTSTDRRDNSSFRSRSTKSLPSSLLLYAEAQLAKPGPQILPIETEEYNSAPRLVHLQVSLEVLETVIAVLNKKIEDALTVRQDIKHMHICETDLLMMCRDLFNDEGLCKNILSALCYFQRLWMRTPSMKGDTAVFDIMFDETLCKE